jgi:hypothetical protein
VGHCDGLQPDEQCLYSYAKVLDQGLVKTTGAVYVSTLPTLPQSRSTVGASYYTDSISEEIKKPLIDNYLGKLPISGSNPSPLKFSDVWILPTNPPLPAPQVPTQLSFLLTPTPYVVDWAAKVINLSTYHYRGPYRLVNKAEWHFKFADPVGLNRLFRPNATNSRAYTGPAVAVPEYDGSYTPGITANGLACSAHTDCNSLHCSSFTCAARKVAGSCTAHTECASLSCNKSTGFCGQATTYYGSYLFPLATQMDLPANVPHLSSAIWTDQRSETTLVIPGKTLWMDGSNARAQSKNADLEHIGSCNVAATIEIIAKDDNNNEYVIALSDEVKLQLVRPIQHYTDTGNDVLYSNFKTCSSDAACGGSECCFNNRCWDQTLVSQCMDSSNSQGNHVIGESCLNDLECSSLCCNNSSGLCSPHNTILNPAVLCSKPIGDFCIAKEWCQKTPIVTCLVVRTGTNALGETTCRQQCYTTSEYGECKSGVCIAPFQDAIPVFDPNAEGACDEAVPAPSF